MVSCHTPHLLTLSSQRESVTCLSSVTTQRYPVTSINLRHWSHKQQTTVTCTVVPEANSLLLVTNVLPAKLHTETISEYIHISINADYTSISANHQKLFVHHQGCKFFTSFAGFIKFMHLSYGR